MGYASIAEFEAATTGANSKGLPNGELQKYLDRSAKHIDGYCNRTFVEQLNKVEELYTGRGWNALIGSDGFVTLRPTQGYPINTVDSITWQPKGRALTTSVVTPSVQTLAATDYSIIKAWTGYGDEIQIFLGFGGYRSYGSLLFTVQYDAGFAAGASPDWLKDANILWTSGLLKRRGGQQTVNSEAGMMPIEAMWTIPEIKNAMSYLQPYKRTI